MNAIIIEDEKLSAEHLSNLLKRCAPDIHILAVFDSVRSSVEAFKSGLRADLIFIDIHLGDGLSFEIFNEISVDIPLIFTTAFDEFAIRAFKLNSVDYLLKPVGLDELKGALEKFRKYRRNDYSVMLDHLASAYQKSNKEYKSRFLVKTGDNIVSVKTANISHFIFEDGVTLLVTKTNNVYPVDYTLEQLETIIDPVEFTRINRKVIISINSIQKTGTYFNSRLKITAPFLREDDSIVSRERVPAFKEWLGQ